MKNMVETIKLTKKFKNEIAVNQISVHIRKNSIYGLLGPNGAGKSTFLKILTGTLKPTSGEFLVNGNPWSRQDLVKIGSLIESPAIYENLSASDNLRVMTELLGLPKERITEVLQLVNLENTGKKKSGEFSLGMKQRLGIAMALLNKPKLLILDEPTNGLDPVGIQELRQLIKGFPKQGITVILSSHMLSEVQQVADDIGIISHGKLGYEGPNDANKNLEELFLEIVRKNQEMTEWEEL